MSAVERYGSEVDIAHCIAGGNLNLVVVRGFARLDLLAAISSPDVYDQELNPLGTQRMLERPHASAAVQYALDSSGVAADTDPRAFPEIILNARDRSVVSVFAEGEESGAIDFDSLTTGDFDARPVKLRFDLDLLGEAAAGAPPKISRVDGNHRLSQAIPDEEDDLETFPVVPFALFIGLSDDQERAIFRDINGNQKAMQTAHLDTIRLRLEGPGQLLQSEAGRALWIARELAEPGRAFEGKVFFGGSTKGPRALTGGVPPIKINTLKSAVQATIREAQRIEFDFIFEGRAPIDPTTDEPYVVKEEAVLKVALLIDRYWKAVREAYPQAWQNRSGYILLQAIGLTAFSRLGADVIQDLAYKRQAVSQDEFDLVLQTIASKVDLTRESFPGLAGLAGAKVVYQKLLAANSEDEVGLAAVRKQLDLEVPKAPSPLGD